MPHGLLQVYLRGLQVCRHVASLLERLQAHQLAACFEACLLVCDKLTWKNASSPACGILWGLLQAYPRSLQVCRHVASLLERLQAQAYPRSLQVCWYVASLLERMQAHKLAAYFKACFKLTQRSLQVCWYVASLLERPEKLQAHQLAAYFEACFKLTWEACRCAGMWQAYLGLASRMQENLLACGILWGLLQAYPGGLQVCMVACGKLTWKTVSSQACGMLRGLLQAYLRGLQVRQAGMWQAYLEGCKLAHVPQACLINLHELESTLWFIYLPNLKFGAIS